MARMRRSSEQTLEYKIEQAKPRSQKQEKHMKTLEFYVFDV